MTDGASIKDVTDTSFWVAYYRVLETQRSDALFRDPFAQALVGERGKKLSDAMASTSRYTAWAVVARTVIIDRFIERLVKEGVDAVINLGTGLDARPYRMNLPASLEWVEVDFPKIIEYKDRVLAAEKPRCRLTRVALDLTDASKRKAFLDHVVPQAKKVLILTEGVVPYLTLEQVSDLSRDLRTQKRFTYWIAEYFDPKIYPYMKSALRRLKMKNAPFVFFPDDWFGFFKSIDWVERETRFTGEIAREFKRALPMPWYAKLFLPWMPKKKKNEILRLSGYVVFGHSGEL